MECAFLIFLALASFSGAGFLQCCLEHPLIHPFCDCLTFAGLHQRGAGFSGLTSSLPAGWPLFFREKGGATFLSIWSPSPTASLLRSSDVGFPSSVLSPIARRYKFSLASSSLWNGGMDLFAMRLLIILFPPRVRWIAWRPFFIWVRHTCPPSPPHPRPPNPCSDVFFFSFFHRASRPPGAVLGTRTAYPFLSPYPAMPPATVQLTHRHTAARRFFLASCFLRPPLRTDLLAGYTRARFFNTVPGTSMHGSDPVPCLTGVLLFFSFFYFRGALIIFPPHIPPLVSQIRTSCSVTMTEASVRSFELSVERRFPP